MIKRTLEGKKVLRILAGPTLLRFLSVAVKSALGRFRENKRARSIVRPTDRPATLGSELCTRYGKQRPADECVCVAGNAPAGTQLTVAKSSACARTLPAGQ